MSQQELLLIKAEEFERNGHVLHAVQIYLRVLNEFNEPKALIRLLNAYDKLNNLEAAVKISIQYFEKADVHDPELQMYTANFLLNRNKSEEALDILASVDTDKNIDACFLKGKAFYNTGEYKIAQMNFINYLERGNKSEAVPIAYLNLAETEIKLKNYDAAFEYAKEAESCYSDLPEIDYLYANIFYHKEMYQHAFDKIRKNLKDREPSSEHFRLAGKIAHKMHDYKKAEEYLYEFMKLAEADSEVYSLLGDTCLRIKKYEEAEKFFELALQKDPTAEDAREGLNKIIIN